MASTFRRRCVTCGSEFEAAVAKTRFCRPACQRFERRCDDCGKSFEARSNRAKRCDGCREGKGGERTRPVGRAFDPIPRPGAMSKAAKRRKAEQEARALRRAAIAEALRRREAEVIRAARERGKNRKAEVAA